MLFETEGVSHETQIICKSLTKRQIQSFNDISCHGFEFAMSYRTLTGFVNDPLSQHFFLVKLNSGLTYSDLSFV
jgi:hypothetical protein